MKRILLVLNLFYFGRAQAQWNGNPAIDNAICVQANQQLNVKHTSDLNGGAIFVWEDYRNDTANKKSDIYAQRINAAGQVMWTLNGLAICNDTSDQNSPNIVSDSSGGAIIVWQDGRGTKRNIYVQRIDSTGNILWTANGLGVALRNSDQKNPKLIADGSHGAVILWQDSVGNIDYDIYAQRISASGSALWGSGGVGVATGFGSQIDVKGQADNNGNTYAVWQDKRNGGDYDIYAQKLDANGAAQWTANGKIICYLGGTQNSPKAAPDFAGGAYFVWQDKRNGLDYDLYAQRVDASGNLLWSTYGVGVAVASGNQSSVDITSKGLSNAVVFGWKDARNGSNNIDVYAQMLNTSGVAQWTGNGLAVANAAANQLNVNVASDGSGGVIICYQDSSGSDWDIKSQRINASGNLLWAAGGVSIGTAVGQQTNSDVCLSNNGSSIYSFEDKRNGIDHDIYAFKLDANGVPVAVQQLGGRDEALSVFPNPSSGEVNFAWRGNSLLASALLNIYNSLGEKVMNVKMSSATPAHEVLPAGIYYYSLQNGSRIISGKFVIED